MPVNLSDHGPILRQRERKWAWWQPFSNRYFVAQGTVGTVRNQPKPNCNRQIKKPPSKTHKDCISRVECKVYTTKSAKSTLPGLHKQGTASSLNSVMSNSPLFVKFSGLTAGDCWCLMWNPVEWKDLEDTAEAGALDLEDTAGSPGRQSAGQTWRSPCACHFRMIRIRHSSNAFWLCERPNKLTWSYLILLHLTCIYLYILVSLLRAFCSNHCLGAPGEVSPKTLARPCTDVSFFCSWMSRILVSPTCLGDWLHTIITKFVAK